MLKSFVQRLKRTTLNTDDSEIYLFTFSIYLFRRIKGPPACERRRGEGAREGCKQNGKRRGEYEERTRGRTMGRRFEFRPSFKADVRLTWGYFSSAGNYRDYPANPCYPAASIYLTAPPGLTNYIININPTDFWPRMQISYDRQLSEISAY